MSHTGVCLKKGHETTPATDVCSHLAWVLCEYIKNASNLRILDIAFDVNGDWATCALLRIVNAGLALENLNTMSLQVPCNEQTVHGIQQLAISFLHPNPLFSTNCLSVLNLDVNSIGHTKML